MENRNAESTNGLPHVSNMTGDIRGPQDQLEHHWKELKDHDAMFAGVDFCSAVLSLDDAPVYATYLDYLKHAVKACAIDLEHMHTCYAQLQRPDSLFPLPHEGVSNISFGASLGAGYTFEQHCAMLMNGARYITWKCMEFELFVHSSRPLEHPSERGDRGHGADLILYSIRSEIPALDRHNRCLSTLYSNVDMAARPTSVEPPPPYSPFEATGARSAPS